MSLKTKLIIAHYQFMHSAFKWNQDAEGDIVFRLFWVIHFTKYKEHTIIHFGFKEMDDAPKYVGAAG